MPPFILQHRKKLPLEADPLETCVYDSEQQVWLDRVSGTPVVSCLQAENASSRFGETTLTETREGADQSEVVALHASRFGETTMTKSIEGADQSEITALVSSRFGETTVTATREGADHSEITGLQGSRFGETTITRSSEGHDQAESAMGDPLGNAPSNEPVSLHATYSHF